MGLCGVSYTSTEAGLVPNLGPASWQTMYVNSGKTATPYSVYGTAVWNCTEGSESVNVSIYKDNGAHDGSGFIQTVTMSFTWAGICIGYELELGVISFTCSGSDYLLDINFNYREFTGSTADIYVNISIGDDANTGISPGFPVLTYKQAYTNVDTGGNIHVMIDTSDFSEELVNIAKSHNVMMYPTGSCYLPGTGIAVSPVGYVNTNSGFTHAGGYTYVLAVGVSSSGTFNEIWYAATGSQTVKFKLFTYPDEYWNSGDLSAVSGLNKYRFDPPVSITAGDRIGLFSASTVSFTDTGSDSWTTWYVFGDQTHITGTSNIFHALPMMLVSN